MTRKIFRIHKAFQPSRLLPFLSGSAVIPLLVLIVVGGSIMMAGFWLNPKLSNSPLSPGVLFKGPNASKKSNIQIGAPIVVTPTPTPTPPPYIQSGYYSEASYPPYSQAAYPYGQGTYYSESSYGYSESGYYSQGAYYNQSTYQSAYLR